MKNALMCMGTAFVFFVAGAVAQTSSTTPTDQGTQGSSPSMNSQQGTGTPDATQGTSNSTGNQGAMAGSPSTNTSGEKKMKGCIQSQGGQYVLQTKHGKDVTLSGQDVSAHVGHEVAVHGMWAGASSGMSNTASGTAAASGKSFNVTSVDMISETCSTGKGGKSGMSGGMSGNTGSSTGTTGSGTTGTGTTGTGSSTTTPQ